MNKYGTLIALAIAVVFGILAVILANKWMSTRASMDQMAIKEQVPLTKVVIAARDLEIGAKLTQDNLVLADWPKANVPKGAFNRVEDVLDRVTVTRMVAGKPLVAAELAGEGSGVGLVAQIRPGYRAMAIRVDEVTGVGGFILPQTFVDVIAVESQGTTRVGKTFLERIPVLAVAQETMVEEGKAKLVKTVTMELTPKQTEKLAAQINQGPIHLVLRNPADKGDLVAEADEKPAARRKYAARPAREKEDSGFSIELIQGDRKPEKFNF